MDKKNSHLPHRPPPKVATPKEVEDAFKQLGKDMKNSFGIKTRKPKHGRQNGAAPEATLNNSFPPQEQSGSIGRFPAAEAHDVQQHSTKSSFWRAS